MLTPLRVLIIEDNKDDVSLIARALKKGGYDPDFLRVETAKTMRKALDGKQWDVILCDYNLPGFNVHDAINLLTEEDLDIPLIIVSGVIDEEAAVECMRLGARDYIRKENLHRLLPAINRELTEARVRNALKRIEREWHKSWENYRLITETIQDLIITSDFSWKITYVNKAVRDLLGDVDPTGMSITAFTPPELLEMQQAMMQRRMDGYAGISAYEWEIVDAKGQRVILDILSQLFQENGKPAGVLFIARNITERKKEAEAKKNLLERLDLATKAANLGVWDKDLRNNHVVWNDRMYELHGMNKENIVDMQEAWRNSLHPDDAASNEAEIQQALRGDKNYHTAFRVIHPDGTLKHIRSYGKVTRDANGAPLHMIGISYDITGYKQAEDKLRESEQKYRSLFTEMLEGFALHEIICDHHGDPVDYRFLDINPAFETITNLKAAQVIGKCCRQVLPPSETGNIAIYGKVALTGEPLSFENYVKESERHYQIHAFCPQKGQFAILFNDITERKKMEAQLIQAQKMEAIGTLAGGIAHDFNNILGAIIGYAGMALEELPAESPAGECIDEIFRASDRAKNLVAQILAFSRRDATARKPLMIAPVIKEIIKLLRAMLPSTIFIRQNIQVHDAFILADATQVHQVLLNLCTNAAHAMSEKGGTLTIGLKQMAISEEHPSLREHLNAGDYLELQVADDGHGINEKIQSQIFDPFFTTKKTGEGTGMGLAVVHGIVKSYGGHICLESTVGKGTVFFIYLPMLAQQSAQLQEAKVVPAVGGTERILLIDDQDFMVEMMSKSLSRLGYKMTARNSSLEALQLFQADPFAYDLVITDQTMPYLTGADLAKTMLRIRPELPIILCTGFSATVSPEQAKVIGVREYVLKPIIMNEFTRLIRRVLEENMRQCRSEEESSANRENYQ
jgi:PAS domain S-box-containing protein